MQPPPSPRSPPLCPDFCGRRRLQLEVQVLSREIGFLEEELQSLEGIQPVSRSCKEVNEFVGLNPDPLIPIKKKRRRSCFVWRWIRTNLCFCSSWLCFSTGCSTKLSSPCCTCQHPTCRCRSCCYDASCCKPGCTEVSCCSPKCCTLEGFCCHGPCCFPEVSLCTPGCSLGRLRCPKYSCRCPKYSCGCMWSCARCAVVLPCSKCTKTCCVSGCLC